MTQPYEEPIETDEPIDPAEAMPEVVATTEPEEVLEPPMPADEDAPPPAEIVAVGSNDYRIRRYIMVALLIGFGAWFAYDGWVKYPAINAQVAELQDRQQRADAAGNRDQYTRITEELNQLGNKGKPLGLLLQKALAVACPALGLAFLGWTLYHSRGEFRLTADGVLHAPGHPPVPLGRVESVNRKAWDRKGVADVAYALDGGKTGTVRLDDFVYQRPPIDAIFDRVERALK